MVERVRRECSGGLLGLSLMSMCRARSLSLFGIDALPVEVEVDVSSGLPGFRSWGCRMRLFSRHVRG